MKMRHKVCINVTDVNGQKQTVLKGGVRNIPRRILTALLGENTKVLVLTPGESVESVEIHEVEGGILHEQSEVIG
ncbi:hypothetical protein [Clostridium butyricum]|uniref:hypothetical protein n=1 Tax=Clostridium butyricum TaxID=1492 RepID=UPI00374FAC95